MKNRSRHGVPGEEENGGLPGILPLWWGLPRTSIHGQQSWTSYWIYNNYVAGDLVHRERGRPGEETGRGGPGPQHQGRGACSQVSRLSNLRVINSSFQHENRHENLSQRHRRGPGEGTDWCQTARLAGDGAGQEGMLENNDCRGNGPIVQIFWPSFILSVVECKMK